MEWLLYIYIYIRANGNSKWLDTNSLNIKKLVFKKPHSSFSRECQQQWKDCSIGATTLSIMTFSWMTLNITIFSKMTFRVTIKNANATLIILAFTTYAERCYAVRHFCWVSQLGPSCWVPLCWLLLCWMSWRRPSFLNENSGNWK